MNKNENDVKMLQAIISEQNAKGVWLSEDLGSDCYGSGLAGIDFRVMREKSFSCKKLTFCGKVCKFIFCVI